MSLATPTELKQRYPEFAAVSDPVIQVYLDQASEEINEEAWGSRAKTAEILLACHKAYVAGVLTASTTTGGGAAIGPVASVSVGDVSVTYAATATLAVQQGLDASLSGNKYGTEYNRLVKLAAYGGAVLGGS